MQRHRLEPTDLFRDAAVALCLLGLLAQTIELRRECDDDIIEPRQIGFGRLKAQLGFVPASMQSGNTCGLLEDGAAFGRLGVDDGGDAALPDHRGRVRARGGIGKKQLHVPCTHFAVIDPIAGAGPALDAARHFELVVFGIRAGRAARAVVEKQRDFGDIARRAAIACRRR